MQSFEDMIAYLNLSKNPRVIHDLPNVLKRKVKGKLKQLKDHNLAMEAINELQNEVFYMIMDNDPTCKKEIGYYNMR